MGEHHWEKIPGISENLRYLKPASIFFGIRASSFLRHWDFVIRHLAQIIHEQASILQHISVDKELRLSCPKHCVNQPERASVRFLQRLQQPWASALRLMNNPG
jgi:hypothetical protein